MRNGRRRAPRKGAPSEPEPTTTSPEIRALADEIRTEFITRREAMVAGAGGVSRKHDAHFIKAAELAVSYDETAAVFVQKTLHHLQMTGALFYPQALGSQSVAVEARSRRIDPDKLALAKYRAQLDKWTRYLSFGSAADTLRVYGSEFSPLLRYIMATRLNELDIARTCRDAAQAELRANPVALEAFGDDVRELQ